MVSFGHDSGGAWDRIPLRVRGSLVTAMMECKSISGDYVEADEIARKMLNETWEVNKSRGHDAAETKVLTRQK